MLTNNVNRSLTGGEADATLRLQVSEIPFAGSVLVHALDGFAEVLDAGSLGQPFAGFCERQVKTQDHILTPADGDIIVHARKGVFFASLVIAGVAQDDVAHGRLVYASDDNAFSFTPSGTLIGAVWEMDGSNALVLCATAGHEGVLNARVNSVKTMAATGAQDLETSDVGKLILLPNTAAFTITLPVAADCTGRGFVFKKTTADAQAVTLDGDAAETIDGAATSAVMNAAQDTLEIVSDGTAWHIIGSKIA